MKKYIILITFSLLCIDCERDLFDKDDPTILEKDSFSEGIYMGYFVLQDQRYWCEIEFKSNTYEEWPSGGALYQKEMSCLTTGSFSINNTILKYDLDKYKFPTFFIPCNPEMILPGDYKINLITMNDSLVFSKGVGKDKIKYHLIKILK
ncbi:MAG: hypothetical protein IPH69_12840 [Bacteroidales bacterium]|nr:hypothetical protein [Bacteroidales bacterium]MBK7626024.1 hypothetical protein [Bacteroidales bacterium]